MYPVENMLLSRLICEERLMEAERDRRLRQIARQQPRGLLRLRLWTGERLVRLGNRLLTVYPRGAYHTSVGTHAGMV